ncbi:MAG: CDP-diacylglycerol--glycerol-3-phosphate 3-phosphatidyltransferase [Candidatus Omnitrophica bacterium]|nr:CDP-diacylglycerol--glycerol-3-phosphate 3-phosphatidyltransferase [Candidatus Omnitrophota bacterium]
MNLSNKLTMTRILLTFIFMLVFSRQGLLPKILALVIFTAAALSDLFDGIIAKNKNMVTDFGRLMDPIADKILVLAAFAVFLQIQLIEAWMFMIIVSREILITSLRLFALNKGRILSAVRAGKHKTFSQMAVIFYILLFIVVKESVKAYSVWNPVWEDFFRQSINILMFLTVGLTLYSGISYLWENRKIIAKL